MNKTANFKGAGGDGGIEQVKVGGIVCLSQSTSLLI
jgi:hypothetical protein